MTLFRYSGIPTAVAVEARQTMRSPQYGHPAHQEVARGYGPCRHCLRTFAIDREDRVLFTYQPIQERFERCVAPLAVRGAAVAGTARGR